MKSLNEIYEEMRLDFVRRTGATTGDECDLAARMYALAAQIYALQVQCEWVKTQSFPQTAQGEYLDRHAAMRGLSRKPAACAGGVVRFQMAQSSNSYRAIAQGTVVMTDDGLRFKTTEKGVISPGEMWADIPVLAEQAGAAGNVPAGAITRFAVGPVSTVSCVNPEGFTGGADEEEDEALRARVLESYRHLSNGANAAYYRQLALSDSEVEEAVVLPRARGTGTVDVVAASRSGELTAATQKRLEELFLERGEIAVNVRVRNPDLKLVKLQVQVAAAQGYDVQEVMGRVRTALENFFTGALLGVNVPLVKLGDIIYGCEGVGNYRILSPTQDVVVEATMMPDLTSLTVEEMV